MLHARCVAIANATAAPTLAAQSPPQTLAQRFYMARSFQRNDRFIIATACIFLASKVGCDPVPRPLCCARCMRARYK